MSNQTDYNDEREPSARDALYCVGAQGAAADGAEAKRIYKIGIQYQGVDETLVKLGMPPNRQIGQRGFLVRAA